MKKYYLVLLNQLGGNLASDFSGSPQQHPPQHKIYHGSRRRGLNPVPGHMGN